MTTFGLFSTLKNNKKFYITCLQYSYSLTLYFPYDVIYLPDGGEANAITFVLPSNSRLNVDSIMEALKIKLGSNRSYLEINNFSLMQSLNISSLTDDNLQNLASKIPEMKHMPVPSINNTFAKIRSLPPNFWSSKKVKLSSTIGTPIMVIITLLLLISLYCKCFQNKKGCVCKYTGLHSPPPYSTHLNLETILPPLPNNPDHISPQLIQQILKTCGVEFSKIRMLQTS